MLKPDFPVPRYLPRIVAIILIKVSILLPGLYAGTLVEGGGQWKIRQVHLSFVPANLLEAEFGLAGNGQTDETLGSSELVDFGGVGRFGLSNSFPGVRSGRNNFAVEVTGQINVTSAGEMTFGLFADDLARLSINDDVVVESTVIGEDAFGTITLDAGLHDLRLIYYEGGGSEDLELYVAQENGEFLSFDQTTWELLETVSILVPGDIIAPSPGFPVNAVSGAAVADLAASGGVDGGYVFSLVYDLDRGGPFPLIGEGAQWKYLDNGLLPLAGWQEGAFDDSAWASGGAVLGYGDDSVTTTLSFGGNPDNKHAAYYFRRAFNVDEEELPLLDSLRVRIRRDDGAIIYINGLEVVRDNLPDGPVDNTTFADVTAAGADEGTYFEFDIDPAVLNEGENYIAVEVHQTNATSSDVLFDLALEYQRRSGLFGDEQYFEISGNQLLLNQPASGFFATVGQTFEVPIRATNVLGQSLDKTLEVIVTPEAVSGVTAISIDNATVSADRVPGWLVGQFSAADADAGEKHTFSLLPALFFPDNGAFSISGNQLFTATGFDVLAKSLYTIGVQSRDAEGAVFNQSLEIIITPPSSRILLQPGSVPENAPPDTPVGSLSTVDSLTDSHSYRVVFDVGPNPQQLISFSDEWKYLDDGSDQGEQWRFPGFDDSLWSSGVSPLGYGLLDNATAATEVGFGADPDNKFATTYFRRTFEVNDPTSIAELVFELELDDGGIVYINGEEVLRVRADGVDSFDDYTGQSHGSETANDVLFFRGALSRILLPGENTIAVEVHQTSATSSDLWLNVDLKANTRSAEVNDADHFYLVGNQVFLNKDLEDTGRVSGDSFLVPVQSTSVLGGVVLENVVVTVGPQSVLPPTDIILDNAIVNEQEPAGTLVGNLVAEDPDGGLFTFNVDANPEYPANALFDIQGYQLITSQPIDYDEASTLVILVSVTDDSGQSLSREMTITVNQVLEPPTGITLTPDSIDIDDAVAGTVIGTLFAEDANSAQEHVFTFGNWPDVPGDPDIPFGSNWKYLDDGSDQGVAWVTLAFDDSQWAEGAGQLGYGDDDEATVVGFVDTDPLVDGIQKNATTYFRHTFTVDAPAPGGYEFVLVYDDAAIVYINGVSIRTANLPAVVNFDTFATETSGDNATIIPYYLPPGFILPGENVIAAEIHQASATSSDISFDFELVPLVVNPLAQYFEIDDNQLVTTVDLGAVGLSAPTTIQVPVVATDPVQGSIEVLIPVTLTGAAPDSDQDGMLDTWEIARFGDLSAGGEDDNDGDGSSNLEEFNADTDPLDAGDFLRILNVEQSANGVAITWPANPGRSYSVYRNDDLTQGNWILIQEGRTVDVAGELTVTDASIDNPRTRFYQVRSQSPPLPE
jgi:hypothetical protein